MPRLLFLLPALLCCGLPAASHAAEPPPDFRFKFEVLATGLPQPMQLERAPDGRIFFIEIAGKLKIYHPETRQITVAGEVEVTTDQENGLLGMALDPAFADNGWIYLLHSPADYEGQIISRFTLKDGALDMAARRDLLRWPEQRRECCHHAGMLRFGPDGCLYASTGDNTFPAGDSDGYAPIDERPDQFPRDAQKSSANTNDLRGKILRVRPTPEGGYTIPEGNLFPPGTPLTRPEIFVMGLRNPWRFNIDQKTGAIYIGDVGPDAGGDNADRGPRGFDVIYRAKEASNFGWPYARGNEPYRDYDFAANKPGPFYDLAKPVNLSPNNTGAKELPPVREPLIWYPGGESKEFPMLGGGGRTACAGPVFHYEPGFAESGGLPEYFDNCLLIYDWSRPFIKWVRLDAEGKLVEILPFTGAARVAQGRDDKSGRFQIKRPVDMTFGPDGALYLLDYGETWGANADSRLVKITYQHGNLSPVAKITGKNLTGREPLNVELSAEGSRDPDNDPLACEWRLQPGDQIIGNSPEVRVTLEQPGAWTVELRVTDGKGGVGMASVPVVAGNTAPEVRFETPRDGDFFTPGKPVAWRVAVTDAEDGTSADKPEDFAARTLVSAFWKRGGGDTEDAAMPQGMALMKHSDCFNCHTVEQRLVGPSLLEIADRYRGQPEAEERSVTRVWKGSTGVWGPLPMLPHPRHTLDELHLMVRWILSLEKDKNGPALTRALSGEVTAPAENVAFAVLEATYTDTGRDALPPAVATATVTLRSRQLEAEAADDIEGPLTLDWNSASGRKGLGSIGDGHRLRFKDVPLSETSAFTVRVASAGTGGRMELRAGPKGETPVAVFDVPVTGGWEDWIELTAPAPPGLKRGDLHVVFLKPGVGGGMMNLDWIRCEPPR